MYVASLFDLNHSYSYRPIPMYRSAVGMKHIDVPTYGIVEHIDKPVCTAHTGLLLDRYVPSILGGII